MALGDLTVLEESSAQGGRGGRLYNILAGTAILAGEPVMIRAVGNTVVEPLLTSLPVVEASAGVGGLFVGVAVTNSTNTLTSTGIVTVLPVNSDTTYLIAPTTAATWATQALYDALVGKRVLIQNSTTVTASPQNVGAYTLLASDSAANGCIVQALDISKYPGKVAIAFRKATSSQN